MTQEEIKQVYPSDSNTNVGIKQLTKDDSIKIAAAVRKQDSLEAAERANSFNNPVGKPENKSDTERKDNSQVGTETEKDDPTTEISNTLSPLLNFNFTGGDNSWSHINPVLFYGWSIDKPFDIKVKGVNQKNESVSSKISIFQNRFQVGPYIGTTIPIKDSASYLPALMLSGNAGLQVNDYLTIGGDKFSFVLAPINFGVKVISGFTDSSKTLVQHSIRHSFGITLKNYFSVNFQFTTAWHNATSTSEENFVKLFNKTQTRIQYCNISLQTRVGKNLFSGKPESSSPVYLSVIWHTMVRPKDNLLLPNYKFITIGLMVDLDLKSGANPSNLPKRPPPVQHLL